MSTCFRRKAFTVEAGALSGTVTDLVHEKRNIQAIPNTRHLYAFFNFLMAGYAFC